MIFFDLDFKYIFICRFLPFLLPGPAATSVLFCFVLFFLLWRTFWKWFCWIWFFFLGVRTYIPDHFLRGQDRRRKVTGKKFALTRQSPPSSCCWPLWDRCPGLRALTLRVLVGVFVSRFRGGGGGFFFLILVCVRVCVSCLGCTFNLHLPRDGLPLGQPLSGPLDSGRRPSWRLCLLGPLTHVVIVCSLLLALLTAARSSSACGKGKWVLQTQHTF